MHAWDDVVTTIWIDPEELQKKFRLPKEAQFLRVVEAQVDRDGNVYNYGIKVKTSRYREQTRKKKGK